MVAFVLLFGMVLFRNGIVHRYHWKTTPWKIGISVILFLLLASLDVIIFYTDCIGSLAWGMDNYYLFTFFPPDFLSIQMAAGLLLLMFMVRMNLKKVPCK